MREVRFTLNIPAETYRAFYEGRAKSVRVSAHDGQTVQFPAEHLRKFLSHEGVFGEFVLRYDINSKFVSLERL